MTRFNVSAIIRNNGVSDEQEEKWKDKFNICCSLHLVTEDMLFFLLILSYNVYQAYNLKPYVTDLK